MKIRKATMRDLDTVERLLTASRLPLVGVKENFSSFVVAEEGGRIVGAVGLERFGSIALLRSMVVSEENRGGGIGGQLVERILDYARNDGIEDLFLLTTTAEKYFPRFGFAPTTRSAVPSALKASAEFQGACPDTAAVMTRHLIQNSSHA
jgi:amino-acid N-acetyltransferase